MGLAKIYKSNWFKYLKNFIIGIGAALVMIGALGKINSEPWGGTAITVGLATEAIIFTILGILPPEKDYYWEKLYPGLDKYSSRLNPLTEGEMAQEMRPLNGEMVEGQLDGMLGELQSMSKSLSSLKALQEVDFSQTSTQIEAMGNFYDRLNDAMKELSETVEDTKVYRNNLAALNQNITQVNSVYETVASSKEHFEKMNSAIAEFGETLDDAKTYKKNLSVLNENVESASAMYRSAAEAQEHFVHLNEAMRELGETVEDARNYKSQIATLNNNLSSLNSVYGNVLSALTGGMKQG